MYPELFRLPIVHWPIYGYGVMLVIGFLLALELAKFLARRAGLDPELFVNAGLIALVAGIVGARLSHVIENWPTYSDASRSFAANFFDAVNIRSGGLTFYGGLLLAFPACVAYGLIKKVPIRVGMDIMAPCIMVGLGIGRIGCFLNGCCYGAECKANFPLAVTYPYHSNAYIDQYVRHEKRPAPELVVTDVTGDRRLLTPEELKSGLIRRPIATDDGSIAMDVRIPDDARAKAANDRSLAVHPAQLYSTFTALLIAAILVCYFSLNPGPGRVMALMLMLEGTTRFLLEMLRAEPPVVTIVGHGWSLSMVLGVLLLLAGIVLWFAFARGERRPAAALIPATA
jgi:phosphatidylglycerol:prolipoprotein diacylglycerol transferase